MELKGNFKIPQDYLHRSSTAAALVDIQTESELQHEISLYITLSACLQIARPHLWCFEANMY